MSRKGDHKVEDWVDQKLMRGKNAFSLDELRKDYPNHTEVALKYALIRLSVKAKIISIHKGYYLIITPQYASRGVLPPTLYMDGLMNYLERPYYMGLINAAVFHGSSHQAPQAYFVFTSFPVLRPILKKGLKVNYISKKEIPLALLDQRKTESGYLFISNPILTAADLVQFEKKAGGLNRVASILQDLVESIKPESISSTFVAYMHTSTLQRLGYLLETVLKEFVLADVLYDQMSEHSKRSRPILLKASMASKNLYSDNRWKVVLNTELDLEE